MAVGPGTTGVPAARGRAASDLYTVLLIIAFAFLAGAVGFLVWRLLDQYGTVFPPAGG